MQLISSKSCNQSVNTVGLCFVRPGAMAGHFCMVFSQQKWNKQLPLNQCWSCTGGDLVQQWICQWFFPNVEKWHMHLLESLPVSQFSHHKGRTRGIPTIGFCFIVPPNSINPLWAHYYKVQCSMFVHLPTLPLFYWILLSWNPKLDKVSMNTTSN